MTSINDMPADFFFTDTEKKILSALPAPHPRILLKQSLRGMARDLLADLFPVQSLAVISDANTRAALGERLEQELSGHYKIKSIVLPGVPQPDEKTAALLADAGDALIAVGSGTINDLCKYASYKVGKPYAVFPTAPSMNGYASANASLIKEGQRQSFPAHLPVAVLCDLEVLAAAPKRMIRAGLGDSLARPTAQADWLLSHLVHGTHYDERPFTLIAPYERKLFDHADKLMHSDIETISLLMRILLLSGFGMTLAGGSYPASQGEHMIAHTYEMMFGAGDVLHGEAIGVTTLTMARLQEQLVRATAHADRIRAVMLPSTYLESVLKNAGAPTTLEGLGWDSGQYAEAIRRAPATRDRFTFLNLQS